jgi:hypothetical protein
MAAFGAGLAGETSTASARTRLGLGTLWGLDDTTASGLVRLGLSQIAKDIATATNTAALLTVIGAPLSASAGLLVKAITGSATTIAALPVMSGEFLTNIGVFTKSFQSADLAISSGGTTAISHGLGKLPMSVNALLVCQSPELGYTAGSVLPVNPGINTVVQTAARGISMMFTTATLTLRYGTDANVFNILSNADGSNQAATNADWKLRIIALA